MIKVDGEVKFRSFSVQHTPRFKVKQQKTRCVKDAWTDADQLAAGAVARTQCSPTFPLPTGQMHYTWKIDPRLLQLGY